MNFELYIAQKVLDFKHSKDSISGAIAKIAIFSIALSITVIICTIFIVTGFKKEISNKLTGFGGHIQISKLTSNLSFEPPPISSEQDFYPDIEQMEGVQNIQVYASKPGIIKTDEVIQATVLKGVGSDFDWAFFRNHLVAGDVFEVTDSANTNKVVISKSLGNIMQMGVGDKFNVFFIQDPPRMRRFEISGIYETTLQEFDKLYILADIAHIQRLNNWDKNTITGFEVLIDDFGQLDKMTRKVREKAGYKILDDGSVLYVSNVKDKNRQLFDWLSLFDLNVLVIIVIMLIVAGINMTSGLLILVLEKTRMIGTLKSMGGRNSSIKRIFMYISGFITLKGLLWGNIAGLALCFVQYKFQPIQLDPSAYFLSAVPIHFNLLYLVLINLGAFAAIWLVLLMPSTVIARVTPAETVKYE
jgi:lipoprotein-releasing system permease protein